MMVISRREVLKEVVNYVGLVAVPLLVVRSPKEKRRFVVKSAKDLPIFSYSSKDRKCLLECEDGYFHMKTLKEVKHVNRDIYNYITHLESCGIPIG